MKSLFIVGSKLMGLFCLYVSTINIVTFLPLWTSVDADPKIVSQMLPTMISYIFLFVVALLLAFRTDWFASLVRLQADDPWPNISRQDLLQTGSILIGLYILSINVGPVLVTITYHLTLPPYMKYDISQMPEDVFGLIYSLVLILGAKRITGFLNQKQV